MSTIGSRIATVRLVGGRPAIDLVNTVSWRGDATRREEHLRSTGDCLTWIGRTELLTPRDRRSLKTLCARDGDAGAQLLKTLRATRQLIADHLIDPAAPHLEPLSAVIRSAIRDCRLINRHGQIQWAPALDAKTPAILVALDLNDLLTYPTGRLAVCQDADCRWAFIDTSRQHNRRWCSSDDCGNRHRVRRHYQNARPTHRQTVTSPTRAGVRAR